MPRSDDPGLASLPHVDLDQQLVSVLGKGQRWGALSIGSKTALAVDRYLRARRAHPQAWRLELWLGGFESFYMSEHIVMYSGSDRGPGGVRV